IAAVIRRALAVAALVVGVFAAPASGAKTPSYPISFHAFDLPKGGLTMPRNGLSTVTYADPFGYPTRDYLASSWTSPWYSTTFGFTELVSSWNAATPPGT